MAGDTPGLRRRIGWLESYLEVETAVPPHSNGADPSDCSTIAAVLPRHELLTVDSSDMAVTPLPPPPPRKVSYVLPPPSSLPPTLSLPPAGISRRGQTGPLYSLRAPPPSDSSLSNGSSSKIGRFAQEQGGHPRHRLAVQALALDLSTALSSGSSGKNREGETDPGGILYTGGRDGLVCAWELDLPTKRRKRRYGRSSVEEEPYDSESSGSDEEVLQRSRRETSDPLDLDDLGTRTVSVSSRRKLRADAVGGRRNNSRDARRGVKVEEQEPIPLEEKWEVDDERVKSMVPPSAKFRQCIQSHTDVGSLVLYGSLHILIGAAVGERYRPLRLQPNACASSLLLFRGPRSPRFLHQ